MSALTVGKGPHTWCDPCQGTHSDAPCTPDGMVTVTIAGDTYLLPMATANLLERIALDDVDGRLVSTDHLDDDGKDLRK